MKKEIKIIEKGEKQIGIRLPREMWGKCDQLARKHKTSIQKVIIFVLRNEIDNYK